MQAKLLQGAAEQELERVGGDETIQVDVRVVAATNRDLEAACDGGDFRPDLYDRLNVLPLTIASLTARRHPLLSAHFLTMASQLHDRPNVRLTESAIGELGRYDFPGNVHELRNVVELVILTPDDVIDEHAVKACSEPPARRHLIIYQ